MRSVEGNIKCVVVHAGRLFGAARGEEPVPFLTGPKAEPVLDESITRQAVLVGPGTVLSSVSRVKMSYTHRYCFSECFLFYFVLCYFIIFI